MIFVTEEDHSTPSSVILPDDDNEYEGLIKASGEINWDCPCLQGMADGPCGEQFKDAFSCFHYSEAEVKGADCVPQFRDMQICFSKYPEIYGKDEEKEEKHSNDVKEEGSDNIDSLEKDVQSSSQEIELSTLSENGSSNGTTEEKPES